MTLFSPMPTSVWDTLLGAGFVVLFLGWVQLEKRLKGNTGLWRRSDRRTASATTAMVSLLFLELAGYTLQFPLGYFLTLGITVVICGLYFIMSPDKPHFWQHQRLRWPIAGLLTTALVAIGVTLPGPVWLPCLGAVIIFHHHFVSHIALEQDALEDMQTLTQKVLRLEAEMEAHTHSQPHPSAALPPHPGFEERSKPSA